jgi:hypothetical protein
MERKAQTRGDPRIRTSHARIPSFFWLCTSRLALCFCGRRVHGPRRVRGEETRPFCPSPSPRDPSAPNGTPYGVL